MAAAGRRISAYIRSIAGRINIGGQVIQLVQIPSHFTGALHMPATLRLAYDENPTQEQIKQAYQRGIMLSIGYILLSLLLVAVVTPQLTRPLRRLRDAAQRIAGGNLTEHLRVGSAIHEIADLAEDLERMRETLIQN